MSAAIRSLAELIAEASLLAGEDLCAAGHAWESEGGRHCPNDWPVDCSQAVYRCARCGAYDYGERGGPGHRDCATLCRFTAAVFEEPDEQEQLGSEA